MLNVFSCNVDEFTININTDDSLRREVPGDAKSNVTDVASNIEDFLPSEPLLLEQLETWVHFVAYIPVAVILVIIPILEIGILRVDMFWGNEVRIRQVWVLVHRRMSLMGAMSLSF